MDGQLRVAVFAGAYDHILDGVTLATHRQVKYLQALGIPVRVYAPTRGDPVLPTGREFVRVPGFNLPGTDYSLARGLPKAIRRDLERFNPSVIHLATPDWLGASALRWAEKRRIPAIASYHTNFADYLRHYRCGWLAPLARACIRRFYNRCRETIAPSQSIAEMLRGYGVHSPITVNHYGVDTARFHPRRRSHDWRQSLGFGEDDVVILFAGRLVWEKGLRTFARTIPLLHDAPHRILIVGDGPAGPAFRKLLPQAVFTGRLAGDDLARAFASADLFFFPSGSETFGCVTIEALASGLPAVVADAPGSREIVRPGREGYLGKVDRPESFAEHLVPLIRGITLRRTMAIQARERAKAFDWPTAMACFAKRLWNHAQAPALRRTA